MYLWLSLIVWAVICDRLCPKRVFRDDLSGVTTYRASLLQVVFTIFPLIFFIGLRDKGADTENYIRSFEQYGTGIEGLSEVIANNEKGVGFRIFGVLIKTYLSTDFHVFLFIIAFISGMCVGIALWKNSEYFLLSYVLFILSGTYAWMINGIRQFLAVTISFAAISLLLKGKHIVYFGIVLLLCSIHISAIVMIPAVFAVTGKPWNKRTMLLLGMSLIVMLFTNRFVNAIDTIVESTNYENITATFEYDDGVNPLRVLVSAVPVLIAYVDRGYLDRIATPEINLCINMSILGLAFNMIGMVTSGIIIGRLPIYFTVYGLIVLPWLVRKLFGNNKGTVTTLMLLFYLAYFYLQGRMYYSSDILGMFVPA